MARQLAQIEYNRVKSTFKRLINMVGGLESAAEITRVGKTVLSDYGNIHRHEHFPPVDVVLDLENFIGDQPVTRIMAAHHDCILLHITPIQSADWGQYLAQFGKETAEVFAKMGESMADGNITAHEAASALEEVEDLLRVATGLYDALKARAGDV